jgi:hypothetical protein
MIRLSHRLASTKKALAVLASEGGWFQAKWDAISSSANSDKENVESNSFYSNQSAPPVLSSSAATGTTTGTTTGTGMGMGTGSKVTACVQTLDAMNGRVVMVAPDVGLREFFFDGVLPPKCTQRFLYETSTKRLVMDFINGFNTTAIVYGQTGSGKSYSMFGRSDASISIYNGKESEGKGIVPRACEEIFAAMETRVRSNDIHSVLAVSYVEIFGNEVSDLLKFGARCGNAAASAQRYVLQGAAERVVESLADVEEVLRIGEVQKRRAATAMNDRSSRAHTLFILSLQQRKGYSHSNLDVNILILFSIFTISFFTILLEANVK